MRFIPATGSRHHACADAVSLQMKICWVRLPESETERHYGTPHIAMRTELVSSFACSQDSSAMFSTWYKLSCFVGNVEGGGGMGGAHAFIGAVRAAQL